MPKRLNSPCKELVTSLIRYFEQERDNNGPLLPLPAVRERVAAALNLNMSTVSTTSQTIKHNEVLRLPVKKHCYTKIVTNTVTLDASAIRNTIYKMYEKSLEYIHSKGIVHHDIKPSNIFIQIENNSILIQLGDFGLACPLQSVRHSLAFGTKLYAAPEQLAGKCNPKSDMYSLGIILFELVENFKTDMERVQYITELRKGHIPPNVIINYSELAKIIGKLILKNPDERPDTTILLNMLRSTESEQIEELKLQLAEKDEEILHLKELLKAHGIKSV